jgi:NADH:ubiquinone oxidoreductase subunit 2 (subunit N)
LAALVALLLALSVTRAVLPQTPDAADASTLSPFVGLVRHSPAAGAPLLVALMSLAAAPPTLGYAARAALLAATRAHLAPWVEPVATAASILYGLACVPWILTLVRGGSRYAHVTLGWPRALGLALAAAALVGLGLFPAPIEWLAQWVLGG